MSATRKVRWIESGDVQPIAALLQDCFGPRAWSANHISKFCYKPNNIPKVLRLGESSSPVGMMFYTQYKHVVLLQVLAVDPQHRRQGHGLYLVKQLQNQLKRLKRSIITAAVEDVNLPMQLLLKKAGFTCIHTKTTSEKTFYVFQYVAPSE